MIRQLRTAVEEEKSKDNSSDNLRKKFNKLKKALIDAGAITQQQYNQASSDDEEGD